MFYPDGVASASLRNMMETGKVGLLETNSNIQPSKPWGSFQRYKVYYDYCRSGKTYCYSEHWGNAAGKLPDYQAKSIWGGRTRSDKITVKQWIWWRFLSELNRGVSFNTIKGISNNCCYKDDALSHDAIDFYMKYMGYHADPVNAPGAWIAFREGDFNKHIQTGSVYPADYVLPADYTLLMSRQEPDNSIGIYNLGTEREGLWARKVLNGDSMRIDINTSFLASYSGDVKVRVTYYDSGSGSFQLEIFGQTKSVTLTNAGKWKTKEYHIVKTPANVVQLKVTSGEVIFHMVEVLKDTAGGGNSADSGVDTGSSHAPDAATADDFDGGSGPSDGYQTDSGMRADGQPLAADPTPEHPPSGACGITASPSGELVAFAIVVLLLAVVGPIGRIRRGTATR